MTIRRVILISYVVQQKLRTHRNNMASKTKTLCICKPFPDLFLTDAFVALFTQISQKVLPCSKFKAHESPTGHDGRGIYQQQDW